MENKTDYAFLLIYISITLCMKEFFNYPRAKYIQCINKFTQMLILKTFRNNEKKKVKSIVFMDVSIFKVLNIFYN